MAVEEGGGAVLGDSWRPVSLVIIAFNNHTGFQKGVLRGDMPTKFEYERQPWGGFDNNLDATYTTSPPERLKTFPLILLKDL